MYTFGVRENSNREFSRKSFGRDLCRFDELHRGTPEAGTKEGEMHGMKVVLVTGSSSGFGRLTVESLARKGYVVFASIRESTKRNAQPSVELRALAEKEGLSISVVELDVTDDASVRAAVEQVIDQAGRIDVLINNASTACMGVTEAVDLKQAHQIFETNFFGVVRMNRAVLPHMRRQGTGLLIHISTIDGRLVLPFMGLFCASKFALEALAEAYRYELSELGIDSVIIEPGGYAPPIFGKSCPAMDQARVVEYGPIAEIPAEMAANFQEFLSGPMGPDLEEVINAVTGLIETPIGKRPLRSLVGEDVQLTQPMNDMAAKIQQRFMDAFGVGNLLKEPLPSGS